MNVERLQWMYDLLVKAAVYKSGVQVEYPSWRFDGKELTEPEELAMFYMIPVAEVEEHLAQKDIHTGSDAGVLSRGIGTVTSYRTLAQRANALAYGKRRRRRHTRRSEKP